MVGNLLVFGGKIYYLILFAGLSLSEVKFISLVSAVLLDQPPLFFN
jgi:hypothetical protein